MSAAIYLRERFNAAINHRIRKEGPRSGNERPFANAALLEMGTAKSGGSPLREFQSTIPRPISFQSEYERH